MEETDVWGTMTKRDSKIWEENDVEVFIGGGKDAYYEFEVNALNTVYEVFWIWKDILQPGSPYYGRPEFDPATQRTMVLDGVGGHVHPRGERGVFSTGTFRDCARAVHVDGVVNSRTNTDRGWTVELAFPWRGMADLADGRALAAEGWRCVAHRLFAVREDGTEPRSAGPVRGMDVESPRALRFAHSGSIPVRNVLGEDGGAGAFACQLIFMPQGA